MDSGIMPKILSFSAVSLLAAGLFLLPVQVDAAGVGKDGTIAAQAGKATSLDELIEMYDSSECISCHSQAHDEWANSAHSRSVWGTGRTAATFKTAFTNGFMDWAFSGVEKPEDVEVDHLMGCAKCHLPQLEDATDEVAKEFVASIWKLMDAVEAKDQEAFTQEKELLTSLNINCLVCHNRMAITHKWTDGYPQDGVVYGSMEGDHPSGDFPEMKKSPIMSASILCGQCHGLGPNLELDNPTQCATAYGSYLWSYKAHGGTETCQDCHMDKSGLGHDMQSYKDPEMQKMALDFNVKAQGSAWRDGSVYRPRAVIQVAMTNRAGHGIPDG